jgi:hypothetical protein
MGNLNNNQLERISTSGIDLKLCRYSNIDAIINRNDKEPSWDGNIYLYKDGQLKKEHLDGKIPIQVKGTEVKRLRQKFTTFSLNISDIKNYYNDCGVIFFVVQIIDDSKYKIFYRSLLPVDLKNLMDDIKRKGNKKYISVKIDNILDSNTDFEDVCKEFIFHRSRQNLNAVDKRISIEDVQGKVMQFTGPENIEDLLKKELYVYSHDEYGIPLPLIRKINVDMLAYNIPKEFIVDNKQYFDSYNKILDGDREIYIYGDGIELDAKDKTFKLNKSKCDILTRLNTIEFVIAVFKKFDRNLDKELYKLQREKDTIERIIKVCDDFNIDKKTIKLSDMTIRDKKSLEILESLILFDDLLKEYKTDSLNNEIETTCNLFVTTFFNNEIVLFSLRDNEKIYYMDYFKEFKDYNLVGTFEGKTILVGQFLLLNYEDILAKNFNKDVVINSIDTISVENKKILSENYNLLAQEFIKSWDLNPRKEFLEVANYILDSFKDYLIDYIFIINKSQIEKRINKKLSSKTKESLYKQKFNSNNDILNASISILLEDFEELKDSLNLMSDKEKKAFLESPIYELYIENIEN